MAAEPIRLTVETRRPIVNKVATTQVPAMERRDYERLFLVGALAAQFLAFLQYQGLAGLLKPEAILLLPGLAGALLISWRASRGAFAASAVLLTILPVIVLLGFGALGELANPLQGGGYASAMLLMTSLVLTLPAGVAGYRRAKAFQPAAMPGMRVGLTLLAVAFFAGSIVAGGLATQHAASGGAGGGYDFAPAASKSITAQNFAYPAAPVTLVQGQATELVVNNADTAFHTFTYSVGGTTYSHDLAGGATAKFLVKLDAAGTLQYWCIPHSSAGSDGKRTGMAGTLSVQPPSATA